MANYRGVKPLTRNGALRLTSRHTSRTTVLRFYFQIIKPPYKTENCTLINKSEATKGQKAEHYRMANVQMSRT